jgi:hypothetical protein
MRLKQSWLREIRSRRMSEEFRNKQIKWLEYVLEIWSSFKGTRIVTFSDICCVRMILLR